LGRKKEILENVEFRKRCDSKSKMEKAHRPRRDKKASKANRWQGVGREGRVLLKRKKSNRGGQEGPAAFKVYGRHTRKLERTKEE